LVAGHFDAKKRVYKDYIPRSIGDSEDPHVSPQLGAVADVEEDQEGIEGEDPEAEGHSMGH